MRPRWHNRRWLAGVTSLVVLFAACAVGALGGVAAGATGNTVSTPGSSATPQTGTTQTVVSTATTTTNIQTTPPALTLPITPPPPTTLTTPQAVSVQVGTTPASAPLPTGFLGFSVETSAIHAYIGRNPAALNPVFAQLLEGVDQGYAPVLRIGGNSTDFSYIPVPGYNPPAAVNYTITPDWLATVAALAQQTGTRLILGVNLAADNPQEAAVEGRAMVNSIGLSHIDALEIGNEPDLYNYTNWYQLSNGQEVERRGNYYRFANYLNEAIHWKELLPNVPLAGAAFATLSWFSGFSNLVSDIPNLTMVTAHRYPLSACTTNTKAASYPSIANLLTSAATEGLAAPLAPYAESMNAQNVEFRLDELNSASCEGKNGVSNTFASALWGLNTLFDMAAAGVDGINIHTLPGSQYAPFSFSSSGGTWTGTVNPIYYGMLMFAQAFPAGADLLNLDDSSVDAGGNVKAYATLTADGTLRTTLINEDTTRDANVTLTEPFSGALSAETLTAPALTSTTGVQLGGQTFANPTTTGTLGSPSTSLISPNGNGAYSISVPAGSAVLLTGSQAPQRR